MSKPNGQTIAGPASNIPAIANNTYYEMTLLSTSSLFYLN